MRNKRNYINKSLYNLKLNSYIILHIITRDYTFFNVQFKQYSRFYLNHLLDWEKTKLDSYLVQQKNFLIMIQSNVIVIMMKNCKNRRYKSYD